MTNAKTKYIEQELQWYWQNSLAEIGYKSSWNACLNAACFGQSKYEEPYTPHILNAIYSRTKIEKILHYLPTFNQYILYATYGYTALPYDQSFDAEALEKVYGGAAGILRAACRMPYIDLAKLGMKSVHNAANKKEKQQLIDIIEQADDDKAISIEMYIQAKKTLKVKPLTKRHY